MSATIVPISDVKMGILGETSFGVGLDSSGNDGKNYRQLPLMQATKPTFNITRESRLLSGRGLVKDDDDTIINTRGGTVTCPFEMIATPKMLTQHLALVCQEHSETGSTIHTYKIGGQGTMLSGLGGTISSQMPHSVNLAYYPKAAQGIKVTGVVASDLTLSLDYGSMGGFMSMSGNYFSGFSNPISTGSCLEQTFDGTWVAPEVTGYYNIGDMSVKTLDSREIVLKNFSVTIANGVNRVGFNSNGDAEAYAFPEYVVTGSITVKYDANHDYASGSNVVQDFLNGDTMELIIKIGDGTVSAVGEANIAMNIQYTGDPAQDISENGIFHTLAFEGLSKGSGSGDDAFKIDVFNNESITAFTS